MGVAAQIKGWLTDRLEIHLERWFQARHQTWFEDQFDAQFDARFDERLSAWAGRDFDELLDTRIDHWFEIRFNIWADTWADRSHHLKERLDTHFDTRFQERLTPEVKARIANQLADAMDKRIEQWFRVTYTRFLEASQAFSDSALLRPPQEPPLPNPLPPSPSQQSRPQDTAPHPEQPASHETPPSQQLQPPKEPSQSQEQPPSGAESKRVVTAAELSRLFAKGPLGPGQIRRLLQGKQLSGKGRAYTYPLDEAALCLLLRQPRREKNTPGTTTRVKPRRPADEQLTRLTMPSSPGR